jgi:hypothetical protein
MLRKILPEMTEEEFRGVLDLTTVDIKVNRVWYCERTYLGDVAEIAGICLQIVRRCTCEPFS